jgi:hypothetical protein
MQKLANAEQQARTRKVSLSQNVKKHKPPKQVGTGSSPPTTCTHITSTFIESVPGEKVNIPGGHRIGHSKQKLYMYMCHILNGFRDYTAHCTDEQHTMSSQDLQSLLMFTVEFSKMYCTR